jgi:hypothetical protein
MATDPVRLSAGILASAISGVAWACIAYFLVPRGAGSGPPISSALLAAPFIGIVVGQLAMPFFRAMGRWGKGIVSLVSLYGAVALFGLAIPFGVPGGARNPEQFYESVVVLWVGLTYFGLIVFLWPLAAINLHWLVWLDRKMARQARTASESSHAV